MQDLPLVKTGERMSHYLKEYEIQHHKEQFEDVIKIIQDLTREGHLLITKDGLDRLIEALKNDNS